MLRSSHVQLLSVFILVSFQSLMSTDGCRTSLDCPYYEKCVNERCENVCSKPYPCGSNALCYYGYNAPICRCNPGYVGDPTIGCTKGCRTSLDCPYYEKCVNERCENVCSKPYPCGSNALCYYGYNAPICLCNPGYLGDPTRGCTEGPECEDDDQCHGDLYCKGNKCVAKLKSEDVCINKCGLNANCKVFGNEALCGCNQGYTGNPYDRNRGCSVASNQVNSATCWGQDLYDQSEACTEYFSKKPTKRFHVIQEDADWFEALQLCESSGRMLAIIENRLEQQQLEEGLVYAGLSGRLWLAGSDLKKMGLYQWVGGNTFNKMRFTNWGKVEPKGKGQHCVVMGRRFTWSSKNCADRNFFVCQDK